MKKSILKGAALVAAVLLLGSCQKAKFRVEGTITKAEGNTLYLEHMSLDGPAAIDSVKLDDKGTFAFSGEATDAPEFYRLRILNQIINLSVDSTETMTVDANYPSMATTYTVKGSDNCEKIRELALKQIGLQQQAIAIEQAPGISLERANDSIMRLVAAYKDDVKRNYIFREPMKAYAYFALFQALGSRLIFDPRGNKEDNQVFAAVATSWDTFYPNSLRGKNLHNIAIEGMKNQRIIEEQQNRMYDPSIINTSNVIDISLTDHNGKTVKLTDLKGKVVMLDFHVYATNESPQRIMQLREYYNKYHAQGFEIYQVSVDPDEHFWKQQTQALPWVCVRDPQGLDSQVLLRYNVQSIPTFFLLDRNCTLQKRDAQIKDLDAEIKSLL